MNISIHETIFISWKVLNKKHFFIYLQKLWGDSLPIWPDAAFHTLKARQSAIPSFKKGHKKEYTNRGRTQYIYGYRGDPQGQTHTCTDDMELTRSHLCMYRESRNPQGQIQACMEKDAIQALVMMRIDERLQGNQLVGQSYDAHRWEIARQSPRDPEQIETFEAVLDSGSKKYCNKIKASHRDERSEKMRCDCMNVCVHCEHAKYRVRQRKMSEKNVTIQCNDTKAESTWYRKRNPIKQRPDAHETETASTSERRSKHSKRKRNRGQTASQNAARAGKRTPTNAGGK